MRPVVRPLKKLPMLEARRDALEKCVYCPKLCRSACPVSNAEPKETLIPWGKMSMAYFVGNESVPAEPSYGAPAWACTGCFACRESCDHENDVAGTLLVARAGLVRESLAPAAATRAIAAFEQRAAAHSERVRAQLGSVSAKTALLVGCEYHRNAPEVARDAYEAARALAGGDVEPIDVCCGLPLLLAGDGPGFARQAESFARRVAEKDRLIVTDAGCALALKVRYPEASVAVAPRVELLVELAAGQLSSLRTVGDGGIPVRYHDPCQLGRGLGVYEQPRAVLTRLLGRPPDEMARGRERAVCSGAGGLLPVTMPEASRVIAHERVAEHERAGGGRVVTACASSLRSFRKQTNGAADDIATFIARGTKAQ
jgi:Fe-S oxidoreductase